MAYSTVPDVQKLFVNITFDDATPVTDDDITDAHIPKADALIDARLRGCYATPITATGDLELLRLISMNLAAGFVAEILYETSQQPNDQTGARRHRQVAEQLLSQIVAGELVLETERNAVADAGALDSYEAVSADSRDVKPLIRMNTEF